ncbi:MAG: hypothetical protein HY815_02030 [Candidatus Riflebacteria bacterium]|nr:hypothetical protein [Candidatus Riflebacteria bacterium]
MSRVKITKPVTSKSPLDQPEKYQLKRFGRVGSDDHHIFINKRILIEITEYSKTNLSRELGGVLVGGYFSWNGKPYVTIDAYIAARLGESRSASFKFTHESWHEIGVIKEQKYPDALLVGWHHTHPSFGIFLSGMDMFIHQGFFNLPWQVALVVDPVADKLGFFQWKNGKVVTCGFHMVIPGGAKR